MFLNCDQRTVPTASGLEHTELFRLTGAQKAFNSCEDLRDGVHIILKGKDYSM